MRRFISRAATPLFLRRSVTRCFGTSSSSSTGLRRLPTCLGTPAPTPLSTATLTTSSRYYVIETNETPNPECLRFFSMELSFLPQGQTMDMPNSGHAYKSPLAESLFKIDGVFGVYFADEYITLTKETTAAWEELVPQVQEVINAFAESKQNILSDDGMQSVTTGHVDTEIQPDDDEVVMAVKELLHTRIRPMLKQDGGNLRYIGMDEDGTVYVVLEGACKSCPSSGHTLKNGIERMLMHWIPEVTEVLEVDEDFAEDFARQEKEKKEKKAAAAAAEETATTAPQA